MRYRGPEVALVYPAVDDCDGVTGAEQPSGARWPRRTYLPAFCSSIRLAAPTIGPVIVPRSTGVPV